MKFKNEAERLQHPIVGRIPDRLWGQYFENGEISEFVLTLLEEKLEEKHEQKSEPWAANHDWQQYIKNPLDNRKIFFLVNFFPLSLSSDQLMEIGKKLELTLEEQLSQFAKTNNLDAFNKVIKAYSLDKIESTVGYENKLYQPFRDAAEFGSVDVLNRIAEIQNPEYLQWMIAHGTYDAFRHTSYGQSPSTMKRLIELCAPEKLQSMIEAFSYYPFNKAALHGNLDMMNMIIAVCDPKELHRMMRGESNRNDGYNDGYSAFQSASEYGHIGILERLVGLCTDPKNDLDPQLLKRMIAANHYEAFRLAAEHGQKDVIMYLVKISLPKVGLEMVQANDYEGFRLAAKNNHVEIMELLRLIGHKDEEQAMIASANYGAFHNAAGAGSHEAVDYLITSCDPEKVQEMFMSNDCKAFREAAKYKRMRMVLRLIKLCEPDDLITMISSNNYEAFSRRKIFSTMRRIEELGEESFYNLMGQCKTDLLTKVVMYGMFRCSFTSEMAEAIFSNYTNEKLQSILYIMQNGTADDIHEYLKLITSNNVEDVEERERIDVAVSAITSAENEEKKSERTLAEEEEKKPEVVVFKQFSQYLQSKLSGDYEAYLKGVMSELDANDFPTELADIAASYVDSNVSVKKQLAGLFKRRQDEVKEAKDKDQDEESKPSLG